MSPTGTPAAIADVDRAGLVVGDRERHRIVGFLYKHAQRSKVLPRHNPHCPHFLPDRGLTFAPSVGMNRDEEGLRPIDLDEVFHRAAALHFRDCLYLLATRRLRKLVGRAPVGWLELQLLRADWTAYRVKVGLGRANHRGLD